MSHTKSFESGLELEESMIELRALVQSYIDVAGETLPPLLFTLDRSLMRVEQAMSAHQKVLHGAMNGQSLKVV